MSMSDEQERWRRFAALKRRVAETAIVEGSNDGLTRASGCDDKVAVSVVDLAFDLDLLEHLGLIRPGTNLETGEGDRDAIGRRTAAGFRQSIVEPITIARGVVRLEG